MKKIFLSLIVSLLGAGAGYALTSSYSFGLCNADFSTQTFDVACHIFYESIGNPLFYGMSALAVVFLVLLFLPRAFGAWKKFAIWFVPLSAILFAWYPNPGSGDLFSPYPEQVFQWVSALYVLISLVVIGASHLSKRGR